MEDNKKAIKENLNNVLDLPKKKSRYLSVVNDETGEIEAYIKLKPKNLGRGWVAVYQYAISMIADLNLPNEQYRVFLKLLAKLDFENYLRISQGQLSEELKMKQPSISRAIKGLENLGIIVEGPKAGMHKTYRLNPDIANKGKDREKNILEFNELKNINEILPH